MIIWYIFKKHWGDHDLKAASTFSVSHPVNLVLRGKSKFMVCAWPFVPLNSEPLEWLLLHSGSFMCISDYFGKVPQYPKQAHLHHWMEF